MGWEVTGDDDDTYDDDIECTEQLDAHSPHNKEAPSWHNLNWHSATTKLRGAIISISEK